MTKFLQALREAKIKSQAELVQILQKEYGVKSFHPSMFSHWTHGRVPLPTQIAIDVVKALKERGIETTVEELFDKRTADAGDAQGVR